MRSVKDAGAFNNTRSSFTPWSSRQNAQQGWHNSLHRREVHTLLHNDITTIYIYMAYRKIRYISVHEVRFLLQLISHLSYHFSLVLPLYVFHFLTIHLLLSDFLIHSHHLFHPFHFLPHFMFFSVHSHWSVIDRFLWNWLWPPGEWEFFDKNPQIQLLRIKRLFLNVVSYSLKESQTKMESG